MKIGFDARVLYQGERRGMGRYLYHLIRNLILIRPKDEFFLFAEHINTPLFKYQHVHEISFEQKGYRWRLWEQFRLPMEILKYKLDLFHSPSNTLPLFQPIKTVLTLHDVICFSFRDSNSKEQRYIRKILPWALSHVKKIITDSEASKIEIIKYLPIAKNKIQVIGLGVDPVFKRMPENNTESILKKYDIKRKFILSVAASSPRKNTLRVIECYSKLKESFKNEYGLVLTGNQTADGDSWASVIENLDVKDKVKIINFISDEDLCGLYNAATVFIFLSLYEGFGLPVLEAMACGCPIIASNVSSIPEVSGDAAFLVDPRNSNECCAALEKILSEKKVSNLLTLKGMEKVKGYTWEKTAKKTSEVYDLVLKNQ